MNRKKQNEREGPKKSALSSLLSPKGFVFECTRCGRCCGLTPFTRADYKQVRSHAKKLHVSFVKKTIEGHTTYLAKSIVEAVERAGDINKVSQKDITCPFLECGENNKTSCKIYDDRPMICRMFGTEGWRGFSLHCPYQNTKEAEKNA
jgi:Fe-S-cluster containining protein